MKQTIKKILYYSVIFAVVCCVNKAQGAPHNTLRIERKAQIKKVRRERKAEKLILINILDQNGCSETIVSKDLLKNFSKTNFFDPQPYQKVLRVYQKGKDRVSKITSYYSNGQIKQYLEAVNNRAYGLYKEWYSQGVIKAEATIIGGIADLNITAQKSWMFDGDSRGWDRDGREIAVFKYVKGVLQGDAVYYYTSGSIKKIAHYENNLLHGTEASFFETGDFFELVNYEQGIRHGKSQMFFDNKIVALEETYDKGKLFNGKYFDYEGLLISEVKEGVGTKTISSKTGITEIHEYTNSQMEGCIKKLDEKHEFISHLYYIKNGEKHGKEIFFFPGKEQPKILITWNQSIIHGLVQTWYENGAIESRKEMCDNKKHGLFSAWYPEGSLMILEEYNQNKLVKGEYYRPGEKTPVSRVEQGAGEANIFDRDGVFLKKIIYKDGIPVV